MGIGDVYEATLGDCRDCYYVDTGMYEVPEYGSVYVLDTDRPALVDTGIGTERERVESAVEQVGIDPEDVAVIALTHVHLDHAGGVGFLVEAFPNATVYVHEIGAPHVIDPSRLWEGTKRAVGDQFTYYTEPEPVPEERVVELRDGDEIDLGDRLLRVHHAPGHAPHQVVFEDTAMDAVFTGDAAGIYTPSTDTVEVTSPPPNFDLEQAIADAQMIRELDPSTLLYAHFGPAPAADRLDAYAETLTEWVDDVADAREAHEDDEAVVEHFVETLDTPAVWGEHKAAAEVSLNVRGVLHYLDGREE